MKKGDTKSGILAARTGERLRIATRVRSWTCNAGDIFASSDFCEITSLLFVSKFWQLVETKSAEPTRGRIREGSADGMYVLKQS